MDILRHEHQAADLDLDGVGVIFRDSPLDQLQGLLDGFFAELGGLVHPHAPVVDLADQLAHGLAGDTPQHIENGKLNGSQRDPERQAAQSEIEAVDVHLFEQQVQVARIFADEERLQPVNENGIERAQGAVTDRKALCPVLRAHPAQKITLVAKQLEALDDDRSGEQFLLENRLLEDLIERGVPGIQGPRQTGVPGLGTVR